MLLREYILRECTLPSKNCVSRLLGRKVRHGFKFLWRKVIHMVSARPRRGRREIEKTGPERQREKGSECDTRPTWAL